MSRGAMAVIQASEILYGFIERLRERYSSMAVDAAGSPSRTILALTLGAAVLRDYRLRQAAATAIPQVAVVGPTQVGKSTVVNLLLGSELAGVNPLAGYTKHLQGFAVGGEDAQLHAIERYFAGWEQAEPGGLDAEKTHTYSLTRVPEGGTQLTDPPYLIWDTPDFDSFSSRRYRASVMEIIGASDLIVAVLSKEKYGDLSVWNMLDLIRTLNRRIVIIVNKLSDDAREVILDAVRRRLKEHGFVDPAIAVVPLPYRSGAMKGLATDKSAVVLRTVAGENLALDSTAGRITAAAGFVRDRWVDWVAPVKTEHRCQAQWEAAVEETLREGVGFYRQQYLETQQYDAFRLAVIRLLELLEVPGLAKPLSQMRRVITWPLRKLWSGVLGAGRADPDQRGIESAILAEILRHMQTAVRRLALDRSQPTDPGSYWWEAVGATVDSRWPDLENRFAAAVLDYQQDFAPEIERAGVALFDRLKQHPATLNALRVARVTTDAAGVVLAVKTGGMGINEVVLTPAMLSLTSFLTESAVGSYARSVEETLKRKQLARVEQLLTSQFAAPMQQVPKQIDGPALFRIAPADLARAEQALDALGP